MFRRPVPHAQARRALIVDMEQNRRSWIQNGVAALAVSVLGLGVAGSVMLTGNATSTADQAPVTSTRTGSAPGRSTSGEAAATQTVVQTVAPGVKQPTAFQRKSEVTSRSATRPELGATAARQAADRATALGDADTSKLSTAQQRAAANRAKALKADAKDTRTKAGQLVDQRNQATEDATRRATENADQAERDRTGATGDSAGAARSTGSANSTDSSPGTSTTTGTGTSSGTGDSGAAVAGNSSAGSLPITSGFSIAARFGAVGSWSRYHTGIDFSAPMGTPIHAIAAGVVTHAGPGGSAGGWAGNYVTIRHADGTQTLYAHQSTVSTSVGAQVSAGTVIGHIGMTGRSFGPHVHVELYSPGVTPGDVYRAIDPAPWMRGHGLSV